MAIAIAKNIGRCWLSFAYLAQGLEKLLG